MKRLSKRKAYLFLFAIIGLTAVIYLTSFSTGHNWGDDFSRYIAQAKSIAEGYNFPGKFVGTYGAFIYPWGFPLLLSPIYSLFGLNIFAMKVYISLFFLLALLVIFLLFKNKLTSPQILLLTAIFALNPHFFLFKDNVLSDIPFFFFSLFSIFLIQRIVIERKIWVNRLIGYSLIGAFIFWSYFIRSQGILLIPTLLVCQYISNRDLFKQNLVSFFRSNKLEFIPYIIFITLAIIINNILPAGGSGYFDQFLSGVTFTRITRNISYYAVLISDFFSLLPISKVYFGITIPFAVLGIIKNIRKDYLYLVYIFFTLLLFIFWPSIQGLRFIFSILPFYMYFFFVGLSKVPTTLFIPNRFNPSKWNLANIAGIILILGSCVGISAACWHYSIFDDSSIIEGPYTAESIEMFDWISANTSEEDIFIFRKHAVMTLYTDRISIRVNKFDQIMNSKANYFVDSKYFEISYSPLIISDIENHKENFKLVFQNDKFKIYKIIDTSLKADSRKK